MSAITGANVAGSLVRPATVVAADRNDEISEAVNMGPITAPRTELGIIDVPTDVDMFRFTVTAGQRLGFDVDVTG